MNTMQRITILAIGLALMSSGCASLSPPADDKAYWEYQQNQQNEEAAKGEDLNWEWLAWAVAIASGQNLTTNAVVTPDSSFHSFSK